MSLASFPTLTDLTVDPERVRGALPPAVDFPTMPHPGDPDDRSASAIS